METENQGNTAATAMAEDRKPEAQAQAPVGMNEIDLTQEEVEEETEELVRLARTEFKIVGIRYYPGQVHQGEFVSLVREPQNPYDRNAVRIENMHGVKVGHVKKQQAAVIAPIIDSPLFKDLKLEGTIPGQGNQWEIPVEISFYSVTHDKNAEQREAIADALASKLKTAFKNQYLQMLRGGTPPKADVKHKQQPVVVERKILNWQTEQQQLDDMFDKQTQLQLAGLPQIEMPSQFHNVTLFDHQINGIRWLVHQETNQSKRAPFYTQVKEKGRNVWLCEITQCSQENAPEPVRGSLLCDAMGVGKTIQTIGLMLSSPPNGHTYPEGIVPGATQEAMLEDEKPTIAEEAPAVEEAPVPNKTAMRKLKVDDLRKVLARAGLMSFGKKNEMVETISKGIAKGTITGKHFLESTPVPTVGPTIASTKAGICTLIVAPVSVLSNWVHQIEEHVKQGVLRVGVYQGPDRQLMIPSIKNGEIDVLLVSYHTLSADHVNCFGKEQKGEAPPPTKVRKMETLFDLHFHRQVLDEAHTIRSIKTRLFKSASAIKADYKLGLTGTPFVNRPDDIHSLFSFLGLAPLENHAVFKRSITTPIQTGEDIGLSRLRAALAYVALRRSKDACNIQLANKEVQLRAISFPEGPDKEVYDALYSSVRLAFRAVLEHDSTHQVAYSSILEVLLRMRQACCSGQLVPKERREAALEIWRELQKRDTGKALTVEEGKVLLDKIRGTFEETAHPECAICLEEIDVSQAVILRACSHIFCEGCLSKVASGSNKTCPFCRVAFNPDDMIKKTVAQAAATQEEDTPSTAGQQLDEGNTVSPKIAALLQSIEEMKSDEKAVIFSQFTSFLDIIGKTLTSNGISFVRIDGRMNVGQRMKAMAEFCAEEGPRFILCSLHAAGTGINLTRGNLVFMMDCWWNQSAENQAMDRVHRIGQKRDVRVVRFVMKNSIEERMVKIQDSKAAQAKGAFAKLKDEEKRMTRLSDLRTLLEISDNAENN
jgi:SWI/SNF-related matrix-associated actin-dependent regulator of chromatin subfamily A3